MSSGCYDFFYDKDSPDAKAYRYRQHERELQKQKESANIRNQKGSTDDKN
ncbi:MAG: hypothetical protein AB1629_08215 [Candidatus Omnitrophota bacterium]